MSAASARLRSARSIIAPVSAMLASSCATTSSTPAKAASICRTLRSAARAGVRSRVEGAAVLGAQRSLAVDHQVTAAEGRAPPRWSAPACRTEGGRRRAAGGGRRAAGGGRHPRLTSNSAVMPRSSGVARTAAGAGAAGSDMLPPAMPATPHSPCFRCLVDLPGKISPSLETERRRRSGPERKIGQTRGGKVSFPHNRVQFWCFHRKRIDPEVD